MTVIDLLKEELNSLAPDKAQDCEAAVHRIKDLMAKILVVGYKAGFRDAASLISTYADDRFVDNKDYNKESEEIATEKLMELKLPTDAA
tara:strand:+ start:2125 stop:2391 length:267 start_codon:yes stop_codon:yes gene_type:complete